MWVRAEFRHQMSLSFGTSGISPISMFASFTPGLKARAHEAVTSWGFTVVAIDAPGHGDRARTAEDERARADLRQAVTAGNTERFASHSGLEAEPNGIGYVGPTRKLCRRSMSRFQPWQGVGCCRLAGVTSSTVRVA